MTKKVTFEEVYSTVMQYVMIYAIQFADRYGIDIPDAIAKKIEMQDKKYPKEIFEIEDEKERNARWLEAKRNYRKDTTLWAHAV